MFASVVGAVRLQRGVLRRSTAARGVQQRHRRGWFGAAWCRGSCDDCDVQRLFVCSSERTGDCVGDIGDEGVVGMNRGEEGREGDDAQLEGDRVRSTVRDA